MRKTSLLLATAAAGLLALAASAHAGPLGLGGGGLIGGLGLGADVNANIDLDRDAPPPPAPRVRGGVPAVERPRWAPPTDVIIDRPRRDRAFVERGVTVLSEPDAYVYMDHQADELRGELAGAGVDVVRQGDAIVLQLPSDVTFAFNKSDIRERFFPVLSSVAHTLNRYPATYVDVIGHTDAIGSVAYNQALSERRAAAVADFIQRRDENPARLFVAGRGKAEPIATNATAQGRAENRRVEILLHPYT